MLPGPDIYYKCPYCSNVLYHGGMISGNTFGAKFYSDGKMDAPMLPQFPRITKCWCNNIVWLKYDDDFQDIINAPDYDGIINKENFELYERYIKSEYVDFHEELLKIKEAWKARHIKAEFLSIKEYKEALQKNISSNQEEEIYLRTEWVRTFNDAFRKKEDVPDNPYSDEQLNTNIRALLYLLESQYKELVQLTDDDIIISNIFLTSELYRYLGEFDKSMSVLELIKTDEPYLKSHIIGFKNACNQKRKAVFRLS